MHEAERPKSYEADVRATNAGHIEWLKAVKLNSETFPVFFSCQKGNNKFHLNANTKPTEAEWHEENEEEKCVYEFFIHVHFFFGGEIAWVDVWSQFMNHKELPSK